MSFIECYIPVWTDVFINNIAFTGLCVNALDGAKSDGSVVQQWTCSDKNARSMVWYVEPADFPDALRVRNLNSDLCLDVRGGPRTKPCSSNSTIVRRTTWRRTSGKPSS